MNIEKAKHRITFMLSDRIITAFNTGDTSQITPDAIKSLLDDELCGKREKMLGYGGYEGNEQPAPEEVRPMLQTLRKPEPETAGEESDD